MSAWIACRSGARAFNAALMLVGLLGLAACTGSPATLALPPAFEVKTPDGLAGVHIREPLPGMTDSEFEELVRAGMSRAAPGSVLPGRVEPPFPQRRIVWHVNPGAGRGISTLTVNIFDGSVPVLYDRESMPDGAPSVMVEAAVQRLTTRSVVSYVRQGAGASSHGATSER